MIEFRKQSLRVRRSAGRFVSPKRSVFLSTMGRKEEEPYG
jgi:hypothetical protein